MLTQSEKLALKSLLKGTPIEKGRDWLIKAHLDNINGFGWPHLTAQTMPTVWGGTNDGIRGLIAADMSRYEPIIDRSYQWLMSQQREDGGFGSREILYSSVEATCWVLITAKDMGVDIRSEPALCKAISFMEDCIKSSGEVGTSANDQCRIYSSCLALWALHGFSDKTISIARFLKDSRDVKSNGWGTRPGSVTNALSTSRVLHSLLLTKHLESNDIITRQAIEYILKLQKPDGSWDNFSETWYSVHQPHVPLRCDEYTTTWVLVALLTAGLSPTSSPVAKAISWLVHEQKSEGYWLYDPLDESRHIWCTADNIYALSIARQKLLGAVTNAGSEIWDISALNGSVKQKGRFEEWQDQLGILIRENITNFIVVLLALYIFRDQIKTVLTFLLVFLRLRGDNLLTNVLSNVVYALLVVIGVFLLNRLRRKK